MANVTSGHGDTGGRQSEPRRQQYRAGMFGSTVAVAGVLGLGATAVPAAVAVVAASGAAPAPTNRGFENTRTVWNGLSVTCSLCMSTFLFVVFFVLKLLKCRVMDRQRVPPGEMQDTLL